MGKLRQQSWVWNFDAPVEAVWEVLADTARFNEAARLPKHEIVETLQPDGRMLYLGRLKRGPLVIEWRERPVNWIHNRWFEHCREFRNGPLKSLCASFILEPAGGGSRGIYTVAVEPRNLLGALILAGGVATRPFPTRLRRPAPRPGGASRPFSRRSRQRPTATGSSGGSRTM